MAWFKREKEPIQDPVPPEERRVRTEGMWEKCAACRKIIWKKDLDANWQVCPKCDHHFKLGARRRLEMLLDDATWTEHDANLSSTDPLEERLASCSVQVASSSSISRRRRAPSLKWWSHFGHTCQLASRSFFQMIFRHAAHFSHMPSVRTRLSSGGTGSWIGSFSRLNQAIVLNGG